MDAGAADKQAQQQQQQELPTADAVREWLEGQPKGVTAVQVLKAFGSSSSSSGVSGVAALQGWLAGIMQQLVDDVEVIRKGGAAAVSSAVDMADAETLYIPLC
jgi:hypothetical protein